MRQGKTSCKRDNTTCIVMALYFLKMMV